MILSWWFVGTTLAGLPVVITLLMSSRSSSSWKILLASLVFGVLSDVDVADGSIRFRWKPSYRSVVLSWIGALFMVYRTIRNDEDNNRDASRFMTRHRLERFKRKIRRFHDDLACGKKADKKQPTAEDIYSAIYDRISGYTVSYLLKKHLSEDSETISQVLVLENRFASVVRRELKTHVAYLTERSKTDEVDPQLRVEKLCRLLELIQGTSKTARSFLFRPADEKRSHCALVTLSTFTIDANLIASAVSAVDGFMNQSQRNGHRLFWKAIADVTSAWVGVIILGIAWMVGPYVWTSSAKIFEGVVRKETTLDGVYDELVGIMIAAALTWLFDMSGWFLLRRGKIRVENRLRKTLMYHIMHQDTAFFDARKKPLIVHRVNRDCAQTAENLVHFPRRVAWTLCHMIIGNALVLYTVSPTLLTYAVVPVPLFAVLSFALLYWRSVWSSRARRYNEVATFKTGEMIKSVRAIRNFSMETRESYKYAAQGSFVESIMIKFIAFNHYAVTYPFIILLNAMRCVVAYNAATMLTEGTISVTGAVLAVERCNGIMHGVRECFELVPEYLKLTAPMERISTYLSSRPRIERLISPEGEVAHTNMSHVPSSEIQGHVEFRDVRFAYPAAPDELALKGCSFVARCGEKIALVGESGSGKSTCIKLLLRHYDPTSGSIRLDGKNLKEYDVRGLRRSVSVVSQDSEMFSMTIRDNILYGLSRQERDAIDDDQIVDACKIANAWEFISRFRHKLESYVGEGGEKLSGGQRQRLALARAIIKRPKILLLDEATSALDNAGERLVKDNLDNVIRKHMKGCTITVAHRLSTIRDYDRIFYLRDGRVVESGTHDDLIQIPIVRDRNGQVVKGLYRHQWNDATVAVPPRRRHFASQTTKTGGRSCDDDDDILGVESVMSATRTISSSSTARLSRGLEKDSECRRFRSRRPSLPHLNKAKTF